MARNTGRGSSTASAPAPSNQWLDTNTRPIVVWAESDGVALYDGEKSIATHRRLLTPAEADHLALLLRAAAREVRET